MRTAELGSRTRTPPPNCTNPQRTVNPGENQGTHQYFEIPRMHVIGIATATRCSSSRPGYKRTNMLLVEEIHYFGRSSC